MTFKELVDEQGPPLLRLAMALTGDHHLAEDLTQSVLAVAYSHWGRVSAARDPGAYLRRTMVNQYIGWRRRRWTWERPVDTDHVVQQAAPDPVTAIDERDETRELLSRLPPRSRAVLVLRYYLDMEDSAIAETLGISASGVRATASRALAALRSSMTTGAERASS